MLLKRLAALGFTLCFLATGTAGFAEGILPVEPAPDYAGETKSGLVAVQNLDFDIVSDLTAIYRQPLGFELSEDTSTPSGPAGNATTLQRRYLCNTARMRSDVLSSAAGNGSDAPAKAAEIANYTVGDSRQFYSYLYNSDPAYPLNGAGYFTAQVVATGDWCSIWLAEGNRLDAAALQRLVSVLDAGIGRLVAMLSNWDSYDIDGDGKAAFVIYPFSEKSTGGFCCTGDLYPMRDARLGRTGNGMDMLNINASFAAEAFQDEGSWAQLVKIMFHELTHLICFEHTTGDEDAWLSEVVAQTGASLAGCGDAAFAPELETLSDWYLTYSFTPPFVYKGHFLPSHPALSGAAYGSWYLLGQYLLLLTEDIPGGGSELFKTLLGSGQCTRQGLEALLTRLAPAADEPLPTTLTELVAQFNLSLLLRQPETPYYLGTAADSLLFFTPATPLEQGQVSSTLYQLLKNGLPGGGCCTWLYTKDSILAIGQPNTDSEGWKTNVYFTSLSERVAERAAEAQGLAPDPPLSPSPAAASSPSSKPNPEPQNRAGSPSDQITEGRWVGGGLGGACLALLALGAVLLIVFLWRYAAARHRPE